MKLKIKGDSIKIPAFYILSTLFIVSILSLTVFRNPGGLPPSDPDNGGLTFPDGFEAVVVVDSLGQARHLAVNSNGDIYVKLRFSEKGGNVAMRDTDNDGLINGEDFDSEK